MPPAKKTSAPRVARTKKSGAATAPATLVLRRFRVVFNAVKAHFRLVEKEAGVGGSQLWALSVIKSTPGIGMNDLARAMDVHQSTASNLVKSLIERGMIVVSKDGIDKRAVALRITPEGSKVLRNAPKPFTGMLPDALASLDPETLDRLAQDLGKLIDVLEADTRAANVPLADL